MGAGLEKFIIRMFSNYIKHIYTYQIRNNFTRYTIINYYTSHSCSKCNVLKCDYFQITEPSSFAFSIIFTLQKQNFQKLNVRYTTVNNMTLNFTVSKFIEWQTSIITEKCRKALVTTFMGVTQFTAYLISSATPNQHIRQIAELLSPQFRHWQ